MCKVVQNARKHTLYWWWNPWLTSGEMAATGLAWWLGQRDRPLVKLWLLQRWSWSEWGLKHTGSAHKWVPLVQLSPAFALLRPFWRLYAQQSRCFWGVSKALLMRPAGILGPRLLPVRPFCPPFPFTGCCLRGLLDLFLGFDALAAGAAFGAVPDSGSRWKATFGWLRMVGSVKSKVVNSVPFQGRHPLFLSSDKDMKAALSARKICCTDSRVPWGRRRMQMINLRDMLPWFQMCTLLQDQMLKPFASAHLTLQAQSQLGTWGPTAFPWQQVATGLLISLCWTSSAKVHGAL